MCENCENNVFPFSYLLFSLYHFYVFLLSFISFCSSFFWGWWWGGIYVSSVSDKKDILRHTHKPFRFQTDSGFRQDEAKQLHFHIWEWIVYCCVAALITPLPLTAHKIYESGCVCLFVSLNCSESERWRGRRWKYLFQNLSFVVPNKSLYQNYLNIMFYLKFYILY